MAEQSGLDLFGLDGLFTEVADYRLKPVLLLDEFESVTKDPSFDRTSDKIPPAGPRLWLTVPDRHPIMETP